MMALWHETDGGWSLLDPVPFPDEATLHDLVAREPQLLPLSGSPQVAVLGREVSLGSGAADLIAVEDSGQVVVIEVKLAQNAEARRAVVAQALAYASYLDGLSLESFERDVLARHLRLSGFSSIVDAVSDVDQTGAFDGETFVTGLRESLAHGRFRVVLVLDQAPPELVRLVGYLERVTGELTIDLVAVSLYEAGGARLLVPQRVDPARPARETSTPAERQTQGELSLGPEAFEASIDSAPRDRETLRTVTAWAKDLEKAGLARLYSYRGTSGRLTLLPYLIDEDAGLITVWNDNGAYISLWRSVFERRAANTIEAVEAHLGKRIGQGGTTREITDELLDVLAQAYAATVTADA